MKKLLSITFLILMASSCYDQSGHRNLINLNVLLTITDKEGNPSTSIPEFHQCTAGSISSNDGGISGNFDCNVSAPRICIKMSHLDIEGTLEQCQDILTDAAGQAYVTFEFDQAYYQNSVLQEVFGSITDVQSLLEISRMNAEITLTLFNGKKYGPLAIELLDAQSEMAEEYSDGYGNVTTTEINIEGESSIEIDAELYPQYFL